MTEETTKQRKPAWNRPNIKATNRLERRKEAFKKNHEGKQGYKCPGSLNVNNGL